MPAVDVQAAVAAIKAGQPAKAAPAPAAAVAAPATAVVAPAAAPPAVNEAPADFVPDEPTRFYCVELKDNKPFVVGPCIDRMDAVALYKRVCGIRSTIHEFDVKQVAPPTVPGARIPGHEAGYWPAV